jgi:heme A synthase
MALPGLALLMILATSAAGVVAALGDTLFPSASMAQDFSVRSHFLLRLRVFHPALAVVTVIVMVAVVSRARREGTRARSFVLLVEAALASQLVLGVLNVFLQAPVWLQMAHLAMADAVWIGAVLIVADLVLDSPFSVQSLHESPELTTES